MTISFVATPYGGRALAALRDVVGAAKATDPLAAVTLVVPNNLAGTVARRELARGITVDGGPGVAGLHLLTLERLAERVAAPHLAPRRPATSSIVAAAWRSVLDRDAGIFASVRQHPATVRALVAAHRDLRDLDDAGLDAVARCSELTRDLVRLHRRVVAILTSDWYDETQLLDAAATFVGESGSDAIACWGDMILYLPQDLSRAEVALVDALSEHAPMTAVVGVTDVRRADRAMWQSLHRRDVGPKTTVGAARLASEVLHASDSDDEVRCVVRDVVETLQAVAANRVAVLYSSALPYARLLHEHLEAAGITVNGPGTRPVIERSIGRGFLGVLRLAVNDMPRTDLFLAVSEAPTFDLAAHAIPASRWERVSRTASIVSGEDWMTRLGAYLESLDRQLTEAQGEGDDSAGRARAVSRDIRDATQLRDFTAKLRSRLAEGQDLDTWSALGVWASRLFSDLYGDPAALSALPAEEQYAAVTIESALNGLAALDAFEESADLEQLIEVLTLALEGALPRVGTSGRGVLVAPLSAAIGLDVDVVYVVGLAEDTYPGRLPEDALLLDHVRDASLGQLPSYRNRLDAKHRHLLAAFDAAPRVVASFPRGDLRRSSGRLPSRWLLPTLREFAQDTSLAATDWATVHSERLRGSASYASSVLSSQLPATEQEWAAQALLSGQPTDDERVGRAVRLLRARASDGFTRFDGNLSEVTGLPDFADGVHPVAPTTLEKYASCPHSFFVERLLKVSPVEQPEQIVMISPLDIGNLMHRTMDVFVTECGASLPDYGMPWSAQHHERLRSIAVEQAAEFERRGVTGHARLWEAERDRILADLDAMLENDDARRADRAARVLRSELAFGGHGVAPVMVEVGDGTVAMRGSADLVEQTPDGTLIVIDIKTGGASRYQDIRTDPLVGGTKLQLPVYAEAARQILGGTRSEAAYWFVRQGKTGWIDIALSDELRVAYAVAVGTLVSSISHGLFPAKAPDAPDFAWVKCPYCNPDGLGHEDARARWERKRHDPALRQLVELIEPTALGALDGAPPGDIDATTGVAGVRS